MQKKQIKSVGKVLTPSRMKTIKGGRLFCFYVETPSGCGGGVQNACWITKPYRCCCAEV